MFNRGYTKSIAIIAILLNTVTVSAQDPVAATAGDPESSSF